MISLASLQREKKERSAARLEPETRYEPASQENALAKWVADQPALAVAAAAIVGLAAGFVVKRMFRGS
jgi:ElaB/YqjD/DUF883 family membrane-anchored ribosome-binding protein